MATLSVFTLFVCTVYAQTCSKSKQQCPLGSNCIGQSAKVTYPDFNNWGETAVKMKNIYNCNSEEYCKWGQMWDVNCIRIYIPDKYFPAAFYNKETGTCSVIYAPITINETVSCCQAGMDCDGVFLGMREKEESSYATANCIIRDEITDIIEDVVGCYATEQFMRYMTCNETDYVDQCPLFFWNNLQNYAKCACGKLAAMDDSAYVYFKELTTMIEGIFAAFRGKDRENCPNWVFSCNSEGDAELDVWEIVCPLEIYEETDMEQLVIDVGDGVNKLAEDQVEIFEGRNTDQYLRVLMYSEDEAWDAIGWLSLNETETTPDEILSAQCVMTPSIWNLNEVYGDYVPPTTPAPTDGVYCFKIAINIQIVIVLFVSFLLM